MYNLHCSRHKVLLILLQSSVDHLVPFEELLYEYLSMRKNVWQHCTVGQHSVHRHAKALVLCLQQKSSTTTISDGEDEDYDIFDMSEQPPMSSSQRQRSARPQTGSARQHSQSSHRPATAPTDPMQRLAHFPTWHCSRPDCCKAASTPIFGSHFDDHSHSAVHCSECL